MESYVGGEKVAMELRRNESIMKENIAVSLFKGIEVVSGRLTITSDRLYFQPNSLNI